MPDFADEYDDDPEPVEAYCVRCRDTVEMEDPRPVWTRRGAPGTRGVCPMCGTTIFRMGRTDAHASLRQPAPVRAAVADGPTARQSRPVRAVATTYIAHADVDAPLAYQLSSDLNNLGVATWLPRAINGDVAWASGVHPALEDCTQLLVILSAATFDCAPARQAWEYFRQHKKRIIVAQVGAVPLPDALRRAPRIDFSGEYRPALRQLVQALGEA